MPITSYANLEDREKFEGQFSNSEADVTRTGINISGGILPFGSAVVYPSGQLNQPGYPLGVTLPSGSSASWVQAGVHVISKKKESDADSNGRYGIPNQNDVSILVRGRAYVWAEKSVNVGDPVFFRTASGTGGTIIGRFRNDSNGGTATQLTDAQWIQARSGAGISEISINRI
jgi:hypothetical protein